jgi:hypothetical protein
MHRDLGVPRVVDAQARERVFTKPDNEPASGEQVERLRWFDGDLVGVPIRAVVFKLRPLDQSP